MAGNIDVESRLGEIRRKRGIGASDLARRVNVSRQTIHAIEAGTFVPNTEVALRLARELEVPVDELFCLRQPAAPPAESLPADVLSAAAAAEGQPVRICRVGERWVGVPVSAAPYYLPEADGIISRTDRGRADLLVVSGEEAAHHRLVLAGCDPAMGLLARMVEKDAGVEVVCAGASSELSLTWLMEGKVHVAGSHLEDATTGEFNLPFLRTRFPGEDFTVVTFARWEEGFVVRRGNPKSVRKIEDLACPGVRLVNREPGSGSRALLDRLLAGAGLPARKVRGYGRIAHGHLAAAYPVLAGEADVCLATRSAARAFGLEFIPIRGERYDFVLRKSTAELPAVKAFLDVLQRASPRRKLEMLAGYDTSGMGTVVA